MAAWAPHTSVWPPAPPPVMLLARGLGTDLALPYGLPQRAVRPSPPSWSCPSPPCPVPPSYRVAPHLTSPHFTLRLRTFLVFVSCSFRLSLRPQHQTRQLCCISSLPWCGCSLCFPLRRVPILPLLGPAPHRRLPLHAAPLLNTSRLRAFYVDIPISLSAFAATSGQQTLPARDTPIQQDHLVHCL